MFSKPTIFPLSQYPRIDQCIIAYLGVDDRLKLSQVSKTAQAFLSNNYFKELFLERVCKGYPSLKNLFSDSVIDKNINYLINSYPNNCWKVFCWVFSKPARNFPADKLNISYDEIKQNLLNSWKSQIEEILPSENKKICGSFYQDPNSEIHKAWILCKDFKSSYDQLLDFMKSFYKEHETILSMMDIFVNEIIQNALSKNMFKELNELLINPSEEIKNKLIENISMCLLEREQQISNVIGCKEFIKKCSNYEIDCAILKLKMKPYENLESKRIQIEIDKQYFICLIEINKNISIETFEKIHKSKLLHVRNLLLLERAKNYLYSDLPYCTALLKLTSWGKKNHEIVIESCKFRSGSCSIDYLIYNYFKKTKNYLETLDLNELPEDKLKLKINEIHEEIRCLINQLPSNLTQEIWKNLWLTCANGKIEDNWSEYHFHEHIDKLYKIIDEIHPNYPQIENAFKRFYNMVLDLYNIDKWDYC